MSDNAPAPAASADRTARIVLPIIAAASSILLWDVSLRLTGSKLFPRPWEVVLAVRELSSKGLLDNYIVSSLFRVTVGFTLAVLVGVPFGLLLGWFATLAYTFNPLIQVLRPISPIAWIPIAIVWFGVADSAPIFLIFLASFGVGFGMRPIGEPW